MDPDDLKAFLNISGLELSHVDRAVCFLLARGSGSSQHFYQGQNVEDRERHISSETLKRYLKLVELPNPGSSSLERDSLIGKNLKNKELDELNNLAEWLLLLWRKAPPIDPRIRGDFHVHTIHSDGMDQVEDLVSAANNLGYQWLGLADHAPGTDHPYRLNVDRFHRRLEAAQAAAEHTPVRIFQAVEADLYEFGMQEIPAEIADLLDYVLVSSHNPQLELSDTYLRALEKAFTWKLVKGYAHPFWMLDFKQYKTLIAEAVSLAVSQDVAVELNFYPDSIRANQFLISEVRRLGGKIILSTDAHHVNALALMRFAAAFLRENERVEVLNFQPNPL